MQPVHTHPQTGLVSPNQFERPSTPQRLSPAPVRHGSSPDAGTPSGSPASRTPFCLPIDVSSRFGARLRELRRERNMTQLRMATDFGIDRSFISDVERGRKSISLPM